MSLTGVVSNFTVVSRIRILAGMAVLVVLVMAGSYFWSDAILEEELVNQKLFTHKAELVQEIENGALQMRRREKDFLLRKDKKYLAKYDKDEALVLKQLAKLKSILVSPKHREHVKKIEAGIDAHKQQFHKVAALLSKMGLDEKSGLKGTLRKAVHNVEGRLKTLNLDKMTVKMLMMRRHEKDFMLRGAEKYIGRIDKRRTEFNALLKEASMDDSTKAEISKLMDAYQNGFKEFASASIELNNETKKLSKIFAAMVPDMDAVFKFAKLEKQKAEQTLEAGRSATKQFFIIFSLATFAGVVVICMIIGKSVTAPLKRLTRVMKHIAEGDTSEEIPSLDEKNEIGEMSRAVKYFKEQIIRNQEYEKTQKEREQNAVRERQQAMVQMADEFEGSLGAIIENVSAASTQLNSTSQQMASSSEETSGQVAAVSAASEQASASVEAVASATEEMSSSISEISSQIGEASRISKQAASDVEQTAVQMETLASTADKIGEIISMISEIAEQTNLLALNATIESARAGEAGKGFAIVASEVKALANETAKATEGISEFISEIQKETKSAVSSISDIGKIIMQLDETSTAIAAAMEEQGAATQEITRSVTEAAKGTQEVTRSISTVNNATGEISASSMEVYSSATELSKNSRTMKDKISEFLANVRSKAV